MLEQIGLLLIQTAFSIFLIALVARFLAQIGRADFYNPLAQTVIKMTNPVLVPLRRIIPGVAGMDLAALVLVFFGHILFFMLVMLLNKIPIGANIAGIFTFSLLGVAGLILEVLRWSMIIVAISSWLSAGGVNPMVHFVAQMIEPFVAPFRRLNLQIGMLDLSFLIAILAIIIIKDIFIGTIAHNLAVQLGAPWYGAFISL